MLSREVHHGKTLSFTKKCVLFSIHEKSCNLEKKCVRFYQRDFEEKMTSIVNFAQRDETFSDQAHDYLRHSTLLFL